MKISFTLNGKRQEWEGAPGETLLEFLRRNGFQGVKEGCAEGDCGACTVIMNGRNVNSCLVLFPQVAGAEITTIEGLGSIAKPHPIQQAYVEEGAVQCGYCIPGSVLSTKVLLDKNKTPTEEEIRLALNGNLCRYYELPLSPPVPRRRNCPYAGQKHVSVLQGQNSTTTR